MVTLTILCPHCTSAEIMRFGHTRTGKQRYRCHACRARSATIPRRATPILRAKSRSSPRIRNAARCAAWRACSACRATRSQAGSKKHTHLPPLETTLLPPEQQETLELDELWSFVGFKKNKRWVWLAMCRRTRQIVAYAVGDRSEVTCRLLWERVPTAYKGGVVYTDFWDAYQKVIPAEQHQAVGKEKRTDQPYRTLEQYLAPARGPLCSQDARVFQNRGYARVLSAPVPARLQSAQTQTNSQKPKQLSVSHYPK